VVGKPATYDLRGDEERSFARTDWKIFQEKPLASQKQTVPETDTGRWGEYPKALERTLEKELGNFTP
jgi:hypothetical protein